LADVLARVAEPPSSGPPESELIPTLRAEPGLLGARLREHCRRQSSGRRLLLFVDQFEELYTLDGEAERAAFISCLEGVADDASSPVRVMLAMRSDFLDRLAEDRRFAGQAARGLVLLSPLGPEALREALTRPVSAAGHRFESEALCQEILDALA